jgi:hypothetical protein
MEREVLLVRDGVAIWQGRVSVRGGQTPPSSQEYFNQAWRTALDAGAVQAEDSGRVQFRFGAR